MATVSPRAVIALNLPKVVALLLAYGRHIVSMMTDNTWFPSPDPGLADVAAHLDALEEAETKARSRTRGLAAARDVDKKLVGEDLRALKMYVERIATLNMELAIAIILSAGMTPKQFARLHKPPLKASMGPAPGEVIVRAKAVAKRAANEWQISSDGATWTTFATTTVADTSVPGLTRARRTSSGSAPRWGGRPATGRRRSSFSCTDPGSAGTQIRGSGRVRLAGAATRVT